MAERKDYSGEFDPGFRYEDLSKEALVRLVREYALIAQLLDRSVFAAVGLRYGQQIGAPVETTEIAPTILKLLGLNLRALQAVRIEHTPVLPGL